MIKKITALLLSLLMLTALVSAQAADFTGTWYLVSIVNNGIAINPAGSMMDITMNLNADGTATASMAGEEDSPGTWSVDSDTLTVTVDEEPLQFTMNENGQLLAEYEGGQMFFGREPAVPDFVPAAEIAADSIAAFDGTWTITSVDIYGMILPFAAVAESGDFGMDNATIVISDGSVSSFDATEPELGTFSDGKLVLSSTLGDEFAQTFTLMEDGTLSLNFMGFVFYCEMSEIME